MFLRRLLGCAINATVVSPLPTMLSVVPAGSEKHSKHSASLSDPEIVHVKPPSTSSFDTASASQRSARGSDLLNACQNAKTAASDDLNIHILLVEDSVVCSKMLQNKLERLGFAVDILDNGADAYSFLESGCFGYDILITDIFMPNRDGISLIGDIRNILKKSIPIIVLSGIPEFGKQALEQGADLFFEKGISVQQLAENIHELHRSNKKSSTL